jgi:hypothetical protein
MQMSTDTSRKRKLQEEEEDLGTGMKWVKRTEIDFECMITFHCEFITCYLNYYDMWYLRRTCRFAYNKFRELERKLYLNLESKIIGAFWMQVRPPLIHYALVNGYMNQVEYLEKWDMPNFFWRSEYFSGSLETILWGKGRQVDIDRYEFGDALKSKDPRVVPFLLKQIQFNGDYDRYIHNVIDADRADVLEQFKEIGFKPEQRYCASLFEYALEEAGVNVLNWFLDQGCEIPSYVTRIISGTTLEKVEWMLEKCDPKIIQFDPASYHDAIKTGDSRVPDKLYDHFGGVLEPKLYFDACKVSFRNDNVDTLEWLWNKGVPIPDGLYGKAIEIISDSFFSPSELRVLKWLVFHGMPREEKYIKILMIRNHYNMKPMDFLYSHGFPIPKSDLVANPRLLSTSYFGWIMDKMENWGEKEYNIVESHIKKKIIKSINRRSLKSLVHLVHHLE